LDSEFILNSLKATNSIVRGFLVERIVLASISRTGLDGAPVSEVRYFNNDSDFSRVLRSTSPGNNTLYIPNQWNYPKIDAVFVSHKSVSKSPKPPKPTTSKQIVASTPSVDVVSTALSNDVSTDPPTEVTHAYVEIQFIQITVAKITAAKLTKTRSVLNENSPERALWRHAVNDAKADVRFSIQWFVASDQVVEVGPDKDVIETVSSLESVNSMLKLNGVAPKVIELESKNSMLKLDGAVEKEIEQVSSP
jgi:hypothetical protein